MGETNWALAQERERHYYENRAASHADREQVYAEFHASFWRGILDRLSELQFDDDGYYVDIGCGPNPIVAFVDKGTRLGIDPLMPFYRENFTLPQGVEPYEGTIEELAPIPDGRADVIFSMNNIDHIESLPRAAETLRRKLKDNGYLVVSVNVVRSVWARQAAKIFDIYKVIDPTHTYHFHSPEEVVDQLASQFELVRYENIDRLAQDVEERKKRADTTAKTLSSRIRQGLKYVKNDVLLRENLILFLFKPKAGSDGRNPGTCQTHTA